MLQFIMGKLSKRLGACLAAGGSALEGATRGVRSWAEGQYIPEWTTWRGTQQPRVDFLDSEPMRQEHIIRTNILERVLDFARVGEGGVLDLANSNICYLSFSEILGNHVVDAVMRPEPYHVVAAGAIGVGSALLASGFEGDVDKEMRERAESEMQLLGM